MVKGSIPVSAFACMSMSSGTDDKHEHLEDDLSFFEENKISHPSGR